MPHCTHVFLVGIGVYDLPTDRSIGYFGDGQEAAGKPFIGCNNLICFTCRSLVKHVDHRGPAEHYPPPAEYIARLHGSADPASSPLLRPLNGSRTYFCRCGWFSVSSARSTNFVDHDWACAGH